MPIRARRRAAANYVGEKDGPNDAANGLRVSGYHLALNNNRAALSNRLKNDLNLRTHLEQAKLGALDRADAEFCADWGIGKAAQFGQDPAADEQLVKELLREGSGCAEPAVIAG